MPRRLYFEKAKKNLAEASEEKKEMFLLVEFEWLANVCNIYMITAKNKEILATWFRSGGLVAFTSSSSPTPPLQDGAGVSDGVVCVCVHSEFVACQFPWKRGRINPRMFYSLLIWPQARSAQFALNELDDDDYCGGAALFHISRALVAKLTRAAGLLISLIMPASCLLFSKIASKMSTALLTSRAGDG